MIETRGLSRTFKSKSGPVHAVSDLTLEVGEGELVAFLGPNGAGKSTSLRMLTTLLTPTSGEATVVGCDIRRDPTGVRRRIGYVGQGNGGGHYHRVRDELVNQGRAYGQEGTTAKRNADELLEVFALTEMANRNVLTLSGGQKRRMDVALGLMHQPPLLFLDEPSTGLDPQSRANLWEHIQRLRRETGMTIVLTTHYLEEADSMAERVMIVDHGRLIADGTASSLKEQLAGDLLTVTARSAAEAELAVTHAQAVPTAHDVEVDGTIVRFRVDRGPSVLPVFLRTLDAQGLPAEAAEVRRPTLDDVFLALTGRSLREGAPTADSGELDATQTPVEVA
ncbi:MAG: ATP-binding cassette domain-containing protein [Dehalococcoidia bacterium]